MTDKNSEGISFQVMYQGEMYNLFFYRTPDPENNSVLFEMKGESVNESPVEGKDYFTQEQCYFHALAILWDLANERLSEKEAKVEKDV